MTKVLLTNKNLFISLIHFIVFIPDFSFCKVHKVINRKEKYFVINNY